MGKRITSAANPLIKKVRSLEQRKYRQQTGLFVAEGARLVTDAEQQGILPETVLVGEGAAAERPAVQALVARLTTRDVEIIETTEAVLRTIAHRDNPQTVIGVYAQRWADLDAIDARADFCWVVLEAVRDPGNLGTILRTADGVGADGLMLIGPCCDPYSVEAVRATMGSIFAMPIVKAALPDFAVWRRRQGGMAVGTALDAGTDHDALDYARPTFLIMGNEQAGISEDMARQCDALVRIPMRGRADSLNLAIATGLMLYEIWRQTGYEGHNVAGQRPNSRLNRGADSHKG
ncbi:MAG: RNA methyltransferase [Alphaproteobacteria bacterium]|jgi:TrmH family RNA methyltransferase|nr:RNA methyltransferase [Alphaproteobacteria bacterium]